MTTQSGARPRRVLFVTHSYYVRDTRPRRHATALADAGWDVEVLCARDDGEPKEERIGAVKIRRLPARRRRGSRFRYVFEYGSFGAMTWGAMASLHARRRYDLIYVFSIPNILVRAAMVPKLTGARVILDVRDPMPEFFMSKYGLPEEHRLVRALRAEERASCRYATRVVTVHAAMKTLLLRTGVGEDKIGVVMNVPDPTIFGTAASAVRRDPEDRTLLYTGTVAGRYGLDRLIRAAARLKDEIPSIRVRIVGDGDAIPSLKRLAGDLSVADRVAFDGPLPLDRIPDVVRASWIGAQPNPDDPLMRWTLSTKALEWCALGLPVVCSRTEANARAFTDDEVAFIRPGDLDDLCRVLLDAHRDPGRVAAKAAHARRSIARYDWARERRALLAIAAG
jgi:glycosyltransferase involved in cell wall biosynthesis